MAHFAEINQNNNEVLRVIVVGNDDVQNHGGDYSIEAEQWVKSFHPQDPIVKEKFNGIYPETYWKQTSYNTLYGKYWDNGKYNENDIRAKRKNFAGIGYIYDNQRDAFLLPKPFNSWILNENTGTWNAPIETPTITTYGDNIDYSIFWKETEQKWFATDNQNNEFEWLQDLKQWKQINS